VSDKLNQKEKEELESSLSKSVIALQLRDILTKTGIPSDETVTLRIQQDDDIIVSVEVPKKSPEIIIPQLATNFAEEIRIFLNRAEALNNLHNLLPRSDAPISLYSLIFEIGKVQFGGPPAEYLREPPAEYLCDEEKVTYPTEVRKIMFANCCYPYCIPCRFV
jgi:hypothetical protein